MALKAGDRGTLARWVRSCNSLRMNEKPAPPNVPRPPDVIDQPPPDIKPVPPPDIPAPSSAPHTTVPADNDDPGSPLFDQTKDETIRPQQIVC